MLNKKPQAGQAAQKSASAAARKNQPGDKAPQGKSRKDAGKSSGEKGHGSGCC